MAGRLDVKAALAGIDGASVQARGGEGLSAAHLLAAAPARAGSHKAEKLTRRATEAYHAGAFAVAVRRAAEAIDRDPDAVQAYMIGGLALDRLGRLVPAIRFFEEALKRAPHVGVLYTALGEVCARNGDPGLAEQWHRMAYRLDPSSPDVVAGLAVCLRNAGRFDDAVAILQQALTLDPRHASLWNALAVTLLDAGDAPNAVTFLQEALRLAPDFANAHHNLGVTLVDLGRFAEAIVALEAAERAAQDRTTVAMARHSRAMALLGAGRLAEGWAASETRFDAELPDHIRFVAPAPRWSGEDLAGKRVLAIGEQGLGDEILFLTAAADLARRIGPEGRLTIACEPRLVGLAARGLPGVATLPHASVTGGGRTVRSVPDLEGRWDEIDCWTPLGDLPAKLRPDLAAFADAAPALAPLPERVAEMRAALAGLGAGPYVGLTWRSLLMTAKRKRFYADIESWGRALCDLGVTVVSLQAGDTADEEARLLRACGVPLKRVEGLDLKADLEGVAAAAVALDLVIGPMNAATNLAAACGAPTWFVEGYRSWTMFGTDRIVWHPRARTIVAQETAGWSGLFKSLRAELSAWRAAASSTAA